MTTGNTLENKQTHSVGSHLVHGFTYYLYVDDFQVCISRPEPHTHYR